MSDFIRVIAAPRGEAPLWVRQAWIGLDLPVARPEVVEVSTAGVLSGRSLWSQITRLLHLAPTEWKEGYVVDRGAAVSLLHAHAPEAAAWWRANVPEVKRQDGSCVLFNSSCGQRLVTDDDTPP